MEKFKLFAIYLFALLLFSACNISEQKTVDPYDFQNEITDSSVLYFKNVRQLFYDKTIHEASKMEQFRLGSRIESDEKPIINLCIVLNILTDRGYIMVEPNMFLQVSDTITIHWEDVETQEKGTYQFTTSAMPKHFQFASEIYTSLQKQHQLKIIINGKEYPILENDDEREAFRITMYDYYRIVGII